MLNRINSLKSFTSRVSVTNYTHADCEQERIVKSEEFIKELEKLKNNKNDDSVVFDLSATSSDIYMRVTKSFPDEIKTLSTIIFSTDKIQKEYSEMSKRLEKDGLSITGPIMEYII